MITISLCMVVKNQAYDLYTCLNSVKDIADEIIIVDTGSRDSTKLAAAHFTTKIFDYICNNNNADVRNFSFAKASKEYILWLDADEKIGGADCKKLKRLKKTFPSTAEVIFMKNKMIGSGKPETGLCYQARLLKRANRYAWVYPSDEMIYVWGNVNYQDITVIRNAQRS